jgi:hypothetical protein
MRQALKCRCLICRLERNLILQLGGDGNGKRFRVFASASSLLSRFSTLSDFIAYLHAGRGVSAGDCPADAILAELVRARHRDLSNDTPRDLLLLALVPAVHSTTRQLSSRYPALSRDDIAQHAVAAILQIFDSEELQGRTSHVAFAISRLLKREAFGWAARESRSPCHTASPEIFPETPDIGCGTEPIERVALLRHFLHSCQREGLLTGRDLELLVHWKLEGGPAGEPGACSNALRQRMKRLLNKLRRIARTPRATATMQNTAVPR